MGVARRRIPAGIVWFLALFVLAAPVRAQDEGKPPELQPEHLAAAQAFIEATGATDLTMRVLEIFRPTVGEIMRRNHPDMTDRQFERFMTLFTAEFLKSRDRFAAAATRIYAGFISRDDLEEGTRFYTGAAGRSFIEARPKIIEAMGKAGATQMTMAHIEPHMSADDFAAYKAFAESDLGQRLAEAQSGIHHVWTRFSSQVGIQVSGRAGTMALRRMSEEGDGF